MKLKKVKETPGKNYFEIAKELYLINQQRLALTKKEDALKKELSAHLTTIPKDYKGNAYMAFTSAEGKTVYSKYEARQSFSISEEKARELLEPKKLWDKVYKKRESFYLDEEEISQLVTDDVISFEELESITEKNVTYALKFVKEKEPENEEDKPK